MGKQSTKELISLNIVTVCVVLSECYVLGQIHESLHIVQSPLSVIKLCAFSLTIVNILGLLWVQRYSSDTFKLWQLLKGVLLYVVAVLFFHIIAVLYGAPVTESVSETFHFACLLTSVTVLPLLLVLGTNGNTWIKVFANSSLESVSEVSVHLTTICSLLGAWLGAFFIPLDWDRPWQVWPITCTIGALAGYSAGLLWAVQAILKYDDSLQKLKLG